MNVISESFNNGALIRLTDTETGLSTLYHQHEDEPVERIRAEARLDFLVESSKRFSGRMSEAVSFSEALYEVITNGRGMMVDSPELRGEYFKGMTLNRREVIRARWPTQGSETQLPYLYVISKYGESPWAIDMWSPFARWRVVD